ALEGNTVGVGREGVARSAGVGGAAPAATGQVGAAPARARRALVARGLHVRQVFRARTGAALDDAFGDRYNRWMNRSSGRAHENILVDDVMVVHVCIAVGE